MEPNPLKDFPERAAPIGAGRYLIEQPDITHREPRYGGRLLILTFRMIRCLEVSSPYSVKDPVVEPGKQYCVAYRYWKEEDLSYEECAVGAPLKEAQSIVANKAFDDVMQLRKLEAIELEVQERFVGKKKIRCFNYIWRKPKEENAQNLSN